MLEMMRVELRRLDIYGKSIFHNETPISFMSERTKHCARCGLKVFDESACDAQRADI